ncbi:hypothetical protein BKA66DRAFT_384836, partial [Pyrenochaeta sp. MPI-SDFR-AT-0127]
TSTQWPGWSKITHIFSFGDSYTDTGFQLNRTQPNPSNPLGNPAFPGRTFSNGRNWLDFLTYSYNESQLLVYNFARGGASVDSFGNTSAPFRPFDIQLERFWQPNYAPNVTTPLNLTTPAPRWSGNEALFTMFFGINDINFSFRLPESNRTTISDSTFRTYKRLINAMYLAGARNFLFMNVPAVHRSPFIRSGGNTNAQANVNAIQNFNNRLQAMIDEFAKSRTDVTTFLFDNFALYNDILNDPQRRPETGVYTNTTGFCPQYSARTYNESSFIPRCGIPQRQFFWLDSLHPTPPIHEAMAADVAKMLRN